MIEFVLKAIVSGIVVATISWISSRNITAAAVLMGIPFTAVLSLIFLYYSGIPNTDLAKFSRETICFVLISLIFFIIFPILLIKCNFWTSMIISMGVTAILFKIALRFM